MELPEEEFMLVKKQAEKFEFEQLNYLFTLLLKGEQETAQSTFPRTMLEVTLIRMATLRPLLPIDEMMKKLEAIESKGLTGEEKERKISVASGRVIRSEDRGREKEEGEGLPKKGEQTREEKVSEKNESLGEIRREEESGGVLPQHWEEVWKGLVEFTRARNPILGAFLVLGNLVHLSDEKIEIGFEKDSFHYDRMLEKENRSQLESICLEYFQKKAKVVISPLIQGMGPKGRGTSSEGKTIPDEGEKRSGSRAEENPLIQEALRLFDGKIVEG
jgi:DNA polymerase-3 subunit gamma/tau